MSAERRAEDRVRRGSGRPSWLVALGCLLCSRFSPRSYVAPTRLADLSPRFDRGVEAELRAGYGARWPHITACLYAPTSLSLRVNQLAGSREALAARLLELGLSTREHEVLDDMLVVDSTPASVITDVCEDDAEVVLDRKCGEAVLSGAHAFIPGVMTGSKGIRVGDVVKVTSDLDEVDNEGVTLERRRGRRVLIGEGIARASRRDMMVRPSSGVAVELTKRVVEAPPAMNGLLPPGLFYTQGVASASIGHLINPSEHHHVVDLCAAPGGKTSHVAMRLKLHGVREGEGVVVACDVKKGRLARVKELASAWELEGMLRFLKVDAASLPNSDGATPEEAKEGGKAWQTARARGLRAGAWDAVLVDPSCTALGLRPRLLHADRTMDSVHYMALNQRRLLRAGAALLKPGGALVYSTCTLTPQENEQQVAWAMAELGLHLRDASPAMGGPAWPGHGLCDWELNLCRRADPTGGTNGFFAAVLGKP